MKIFGIETSCDETAASIVEAAPDNSYVTLLSSVTATSLPFHAQTGGIIPEVAARNQIKDIIPVIRQTLEKAKLQGKDIDALAVTYGPGLIGSLLVGVETARTLSFVWDKPLIPVNHLLGHIYANWVNITDSSSQESFETPLFPAVALIVSGGHTDLLIMKSHTDITWLGGTRDDAAGEAFDKIGRMLGLAYPAGPTIENLAKSGNPEAFRFPRPIMYDKALDFSFSGLKTAVLHVIEKQTHLDKQMVADICCCAQHAIVDVLVYKTLQAALKYNARCVILGGGVSANQALQDAFQQSIVLHQVPVKIFAPQKFLCTDNGTMIAAAAFFQEHKTPWQNITANPELYFE